MAAGFFATVSQRIGYFLRKGGKAGQEIFGVERDVINSKGRGVNTDGKKGSETVIQKYIQNQDKKAEYKKLHHEQLRLF